MAVYEPERFWKRVSQGALRYDSSNSLIDSQTKRLQAAV
jgi:hypothetical protein